jgi:tetratricopeptide repeat protein 30
MSLATGRLATGRLATGTTRLQTGVYAANQIGQGLAPTSLAQIPEGKITATIYSFIRDGRYQDVIKILSTENNTTKTRASLSLLGYCYYQVQEYLNAAEW